MIAFVVINHSPRQTVNYLVKRYGVPVSDLAVVRGELPSKPILLFLSWREFVINLKTLNRRQYKDTRCIVFCSVLAFHRLRGVYGLDSARAHNVHSIRPQTKFRKVWSNSKPRKVRAQARDYIQEMVNDVKDGSLLNPLMSYIYTLPNATHQKPIKQLSAAAVVCGADEHGIKRDIAFFERCSGFNLSAKASTRLLELLLSKAGRNYADAFAFYRKKGMNLDDVVQQLGVDQYEMSYLLSVTGDDNEYVHFFANES